MPARERAAKKATGSATGFSAEERAAMRERVREMRSRNRPEDGEREVLAKIATMDAADRIRAERIHALVRRHAPDLTPRTWYGMPAYADRDGHVVCYFQDARKFKMRYATFGFSDSANLDDGRMWATVFAVTELTKAEEERIATLVKKAVGGLPQGT